MTHDNKTIENKLYQAISNDTPDVLEHILAQCEDRPTVVDINKKRQKTLLSKRILSMVASFIILVSGGLFYNHYQQHYFIDTVIGIDINPSLELNINKQDKVIRANALNPDAKNILQGITLKDIPSDKAIRLILNAMHTKGYLATNHVSVLVSVENNSAIKRLNIERNISTVIEDKLNEKGIQPVIVAQGIEESNKEIVKKDAENHHISTGKATLIKQIIEKDDHYTFKHLATLPINDLYMIVHNSNIDIKNSENRGTPVYDDYLNEEKVALIIKSHLNNKNITDMDIKLDVNNNKLIYKVNVEYDKNEVTMLLDAKSGSVINTIIDNDNDDEQETTSKPTTTTDDSDDDDDEQKTTSKPTTTTDDSDDDDDEQKTTSKPTTTTDDSDDDDDEQETTSKPTTTDDSDDDDDEQETTSKPTTTDDSDDDDDEQETTSKATTTDDSDDDDDEQKTTSKPTTTDDNDDDDDEQETTKEDNSDDD